MGLRSAEDVRRRIADLGHHDAYAVLDVSRDASGERIAQAYRRAIGRAHPDRGGTPEDAQLVNCAYEVLSRYRDVYDGRRPLPEAGLVEAGFDPGFDAGFDSGFDAGPDRDFHPGFDAGFDPGFDPAFDADDLDDERGDGVPDPRAEARPGPPGAARPAADDDGPPPIRVEPAAPEPDDPEPPHRRRTGWATVLGVGLVLLGIGVLLGRQVTAAPAAVAPTPSQVWTASRLTPTADVAATSDPATASPSGSPTVTVGVTGHQCVVRPEGTLWCWGEGGRGQLGNGATRDSVQPVRVGAAGDRWLTVATGDRTTCGLRADGGLACWGDNAFGQVGDGTRDARPAPVRAGPDRTSWLAVATGSHSCAVRSDHTLWCWGAGEHGELGDGTSTARPVPGQVGAETTWAAVTVAGARTCAVRQNGTTACWGVAG